MLSNFSIIIVTLFMALCSGLGINIFWMKIILNRYIETQVERNAEITEEELATFAREARSQVFRLSAYTIGAIFFLGIININLLIFVHLCFAINYVKSSVNINILEIEV